MSLCSFCHRYEDEINKRNNLENDFVILKKVRTQFSFSAPEVW